MPPLQEQLTWLFVIAAPIACVAWSVTHEELFGEIHLYCLTRSKESKSLPVRKFFYLFTCEYCFSHYVTIAFVAIMDFRLLINDWRGYLIAGFCLVWIANIYMSLYSLLRVDIKKEKVIAEHVEENGKSGE